MYILRIKYTEIEFRIFIFSKGVFGFFPNTGNVVPVQFLIPLWKQLYNSYKHKRTI